MSSIYNKDLKESGELSFENRKEYSWLKWDESISIVDVTGHSTAVGFPVLKLAAFDINNDNKDETVIFARSSLGSVLRDTLYVYPITVSRHRDRLSWPEINKVKLVSIGGGFAYYLRDLPAQAEREFFGKTKKYYLDIGAFMYIRPLKIENAYYLGLFGGVGQGNIYTSLDKTNIATISRIGADNVLTDICYFIKSYTIGERGSK